MPRSFALPPLRPTVEAALRDVGSKDPRYRVMAAEALAHAEGGQESDARAALQALMADPDLRVRATAAESLGLLGGPGVVSALVTIASDPEPDVRLAALGALARLGEPDGADAARKAATDTSPAVREAAASAILRLEGREALPALLVLATDASPDVRAAAAACLAGFGDEVRDRLAAMLDDPDVDVRAEAAFALAPMGEQRATPTLLALLGDRRVARDAAEALGRLGDERAVAPLERLLGRFFLSRWMRVTVAAALARLGRKTGERALVDILRRKRWDATALAAEEAAALGLGDALEPIRRLAADPPATLGSEPFERALRALAGGGEP